jgi:hypothetical protein
MDFQSKPTAKNCSRCDKGFQCGTHEAHGACWCSLYPTLEPVNEKEDCLCSDCLGKATLFAPSKEK